MRAPVFSSALAAFFALMVWAWVASAVKLQVRGSTELDARASIRDGRLELKGSITDDTGRPVGQARVRVRATRERGGPALRLGRPVGCGETGQRQIHAGSDELLVDTNGSGAFCVSLPDLDRRAALSVSFDGDRFHEKSSTELDVDSSRRSLVLTFSPAPAQLALERESHAIWLDARVDPVDETVSEALQLRLMIEERDGNRRELGRASIRSGERAELVVKSKDLGAAGPATLVAEFAGSDTTQPARRAAPVQRTVKVALSVAGKVPAADPSAGLELDVAVGSSAGAVNAGAVEMLAGGESVGTAPVRGGAAHVASVFPLPASGPITVTLRYLPEAPWWLPGDPVVISVPVAPPSPWRRLPWVLAALGIGAWVVRTWWRPTRTEKPEKDRASLPPGRPSLDVIEVGPERSGWRGRVVDAHEGHAIADASVVILLPAFASDGVAARAFSDDEGRFELPAVQRMDGARLQVSSRWHSTLLRDLPPAGHLQVSLVSRRRALLSRLVDWAGRMGKPWTTPGDPTPRHVASVARARHADDVALWAGEVERAAFGADAPDAEVEDRIREQEPAWRSGDDARR
ncbi:MAG: hypothetical protein L6Q84_19245 [Polyangiaceae bacterium]|nr:hypothetical protein [Polyangiaceae bacterium]